MECQASRCEDSRCIHLYIGYEQQEDLICTLTHHYSQISVLIGDITIFNVEDISFYISKIIHKQLTGAHIHNKTCYYINYRSTKLQRENKTILRSKDDPKKYVDTSVLQYINVLNNEGEMVCLKLECYFGKIA